MTQPAAETSTVHREYWEDYVPGRVYQIGPVTADETEMLEFARRYDPQIFHVDPEAAKQTIYGGLIASGWYTCSLVMRLFAGAFISRAASLGSPGLDELRWLKPVRPGDELRIRVEILSSRESRSKPDRGIVYSAVQAMNQKEEIVLTMKVINLFLRRPQS